MRIFTTVVRKNRNDMSLLWCRIRADLCGFCIGRPKHRLAPLKFSALCRFCVGLIRHSAVFHGISANSTSKKSHVHTTHYKSAAEKNLCGNPRPVPRQKQQYEHILKGWVHKTDFDTKLAMSPVQKFRILFIWMGNSRCSSHSCRFFPLLKNPRKKKKWRGICTNSTSNSWDTD